MNALLPCPVCKTDPIPKGHVHYAADLTPEAWPRLVPPFTVTVDQIAGIDPDFTGDKTAVEHVRDNR